MDAWTPRQLDTVGRSEEIDIAPVRPDGSLRPATTIWVVRVGDDVYVRSYRGRGGGWFRDAVATHAGHVRAGRIALEVAFEERPDADRSAIDEAYRTKYRQHDDSYVDPMVSDDAAAATLRLVPAKPTK
jgi:hypothetical protein